MLIRVVLAVNDFIFRTGFSEKDLRVSSGDIIRRYSGRSGVGQKLNRGRHLNCVILAPGFPRRRLGPLVLAFWPVFL
jgi:hypothetical protein